ncbi:hypothetical protein GCM10023321_07320 [Pseudonocardia eucalypti]|uniref:SpoVT-AbrB domain-containing protein n=1 Tax=Pseudonocardia eucalypti TaxID=648755 RepID=A0ABP9PI72_9PSEU|nr:AbrB family looped-hinge helix DNA binding protein [Pseudonocardia eucalypti]
MKATVSEKGQVTIPKQLRRELGIEPGETLEFAVEDGRLVAHKVRQRDPVDSVYGILRGGQSADEFLNEIRGPVELP